MSNEKALDRFASNIEQSRNEVEKIKTVLDDFLNVALDDVNWAHAEGAGRLLKDLKDITPYLGTH